MMKYRKKPIIVDAILWDGGNWDEIEKFSPYGILYDYPAHRQSLSIKTLEGEMTANKGDMIVKGIQGEIYPVKPDIFNATYERIIPQPIAKREER
jgi:hypothetical protein